MKRSDAMRYATDRFPARLDPEIGGTRDGTGEGWEYGGTYHAVAPGSDRTACGLRAGGMYPMGGAWDGGLWSDRMCDDCDEALSA